MHFKEQKESKEKRWDKDVYNKRGRLLQMSGPNLHEWQRAKLQGIGVVGGYHPNPRSAFF